MGCPLFFFPAIAVLSCPPTRLLKKRCDRWENQEKTEILTKLVRRRRNRVSAIFVKTTCFRQGTKAPFSKTTVSTTLIIYPKHLLRQNFPSKGKLGEFFLIGKIFPLRDNFPLKIAFPFPRNGQFSHEMKGFRKRSFYGLKEIYDFPPRGKIYLKPFFASKDVMGNLCWSRFRLHQDLLRRFSFFVIGVPLTKCSFPLAGAPRMLLLQLEQGPEELGLVHLGYKSETRKVATMIS